MLGPSLRMRKKLEYPPWARSMCFLIFDRVRLKDWEITVYSLVSCCMFLLSPLLNHGTRI